LYSSGAKFQGEWIEDKVNGKGLMIYPSKDKYEGDFKDGIKKGSGIYEHVDGSRYEGKWENDDKNGNGVLYYSNGDTYEGSFLDGRKKWKRNI